MFEIGDYVVSVNNGICRVEDIVRLNLSTVDRRQKYYLLVPLEEPTAKIYIPKDGTTHGMRRVMTEEEAKKVIDEIPQIEEVWIDDEKQREQTYKDVIKDGRPEQLVRIIKTMYHRRQDRLAQGKKNTAIDERYFKIAENNLYAELAFATGHEKEKMPEFIREKIEG